MIHSLSVSHNPREVYKLKKALYGFKQAPCVWFVKLFDVLTSLGFHLIHHDPTLFLKYTFAAHIFLSIYVDDMIIIGDDINGIVVLKSDLASCFEMNYLGVLQYFLGIEVASFSEKLLSHSLSTQLIFLIDLTLLILRLLIVILRLMFDILLLIVTPCQTLLCIVPLLVAWFISSLHIQITHIIHIVSQFVASTIVY